MRRCIKKLIVLCLLVAVIVTNVSITSAATYVGQKTVREGGFLGIGGTKYTYELYYDYGTRITMTKPSRLLSNSLHHTYGKTPMTIYGDETRAFTISKTENFNVEIGCNIGISQLVELAANMGYGETTGVSFSKAFIRGQSFKPDRYDKTGFYVIAPGVTCRRMSWKKYKTSTNGYITGSNFRMPYGNNAAYILYSPSNSNWKFYS
jgi:hypothetical protein